MALPKGLSHPRPGAPLQCCAGTAGRGLGAIRCHCAFATAGFRPSSSTVGTVGWLLISLFFFLFFFCKGGSEFCCNCILNDSFGLSTGGSSRGPGSNKSTEGSRLECKRHSAAWAAERSPQSPSPPHARATRLPRPPHSHPTAGGSPGSTLLWGSSSLASQKLPPRKGHLEVSSHQRLPQPFATYVFVHALDTCSLSHLTLCKY